MRLVSFNIRHGLADAGGVDHDRYRAAVAALDADVLAIQEADRGHPRSGRVDFTAVAASQSGAVAWHFAPTRRYAAGLWWPVARPATASSAPHGPVASYGIGLVSRFPVDRWLRLELPRARLGQRLRAMPPRTDEPRVAIAACVRSPAGPLTVLATHLSASGPVAAEQLRALVRAAAGLPRPLVLLGDLNISAPGPATITGWRPLASAATYPRLRPRRQIDHILADGPVRALGPAEALNLGLSDHRALAVNATIDETSIDDSSQLNSLGRHL